MLGPDFDIAKRVKGNQRAENLGAESDFSRLPNSFSIRIGVTDDRKQRLRVLLQGHFSSRFITRTSAQKLFGVARWVACPVFGRVGLAMLAPLRQVKSRTLLIPGSELCQSLGAFYDIIPKLMPVEFPLYRRKDHAVVVFSDASWSAQSNCMGIVVWCPYRQALYFSSHIIPRHIVTLFDSLSYNLHIYAKPSC